MYATVSTDDSVIVIGGSDSSNPVFDVGTITEYKNDEWSYKGNLKRDRRGHGAILYQGLSIDYID